MSVAFNPHHRLILVHAVLIGPFGPAKRVALDTGATRTQIDTSFLMAVGHDPAAATRHVLVTTASGVEHAPLITINRLEALGQRRDALTVLAMTLPPSAGIHGLLGLDFFRGLKLEIDFRTGTIDLS